MLNSPLSMALMWSDDGVLLYNDTDATFAADKHLGILRAKVLDPREDARELNE